MTDVLSSPAFVLLEKLRSIDLEALPVSDLDRCVSLKVQAAETRKLFKSLGIKKVSVTAPRYSMASSVRFSPPYDEAISRSQRREIHDLLDKLLDHAFPNFVDRSDSMTDYFDFCWSIH